MGSCLKRFIGVVGLVLGSAVSVSAQAVPANTTTGVIFIRSVSGLFPVTSIAVDNGSVSAPSITFTGDTNTGWYLVAPDIIGVANAGAQIATWASGALTLKTHLLFSADNTFDIGASGATRPRNLYVGTSVRAPDGTAAVPSLTFTSDAVKGIYSPAANRLGFVINTVEIAEVNSQGSFVGIDLGSAGAMKWGANINAADVYLVRDGAANTLALKNGTNAQTFRAYKTTTGSVYTSLSGASAITAGADVTVNNPGRVEGFVYKATINPVGGTNCTTAFAAASTTADCTIATLPAKTKLIAVYADVTTGFTCSATCSGTKTISVGKTAGGTEILTSGLSVVTTNTQFGLADADLGTAMTRAAAIQGGYLPSWSGTTDVIVRFTSGTGNWGNGSVTNVNAGAITFYLTTQSMP